MSAESKLPDGWMLLSIYGIWSKAEKKVIFVSLKEEDVELEFDLEGYDDETHAIVCLACGYDISSLLS